MFFIYYYYYYYSSYSCYYYSRQSEGAFLDDYNNNYNNTVNYIFLGGDVDDLTYDSERLHGFQVERPFRAARNTMTGGRPSTPILIPPPAAGSNMLNGYGHVTVNWVKQWDKETRYCLIIR